MRCYKLIELTKLLELKGMTPELITEAWKVHNIHFIFKWISFPTLKEDAEKFAINQGWDPETALMLYSMPTDNQDGKEVLANIITKELSKSALLNFSQCICQFFENITLEELAGKINQIKRMKAFL